MSSYLVILFSIFLASCTSLQNSGLDDSKSPGHEYGRQMDERSLKAGFMER